MFRDDSQKDRRAGKSQKINSSIGLPSEVFENLTPGAHKHFLWLIQDFVRDIYGEASRLEKRARTGRIQEITAGHLGQAHTLYTGGMIPRRAILRVVLTRFFQYISMTIVGFGLSNYKEIWALPVIVGGVVAISVLVMAELYIKGVF